MVYEKIETSAGNMRKTILVQGKMTSLRVYESKMFAKQCIVERRFVNCVGERTNGVWVYSTWYTYVHI
jgi:hypothetical protein